MKVLEAEQLDLLLVDSRIRIEKDRFPSDSSFVYARLCDSPDIEELEGNPAICKYQKADILFKQILSLYADHSAQMKFRHGTSLAHILLFTSAQGGSGTSAVAAACALHMAKQGKESAIWICSRWEMRNSIFPQAVMPHSQMRSML